MIQIIAEPANKAARPIDGRAASHQSHPSYKDHPSLPDFLTLTAIQVYPTASYVPSGKRSLNTQATAMSASVISERPGGAGPISPMLPPGSPTSVCSPTVTSATSSSDVGFEVSSAAPSCHNGEENNANNKPNESQSDAESQNDNSDVIELPPHDMPIVGAIDGVPLWCALFGPEVYLNDEHDDEEEKEEGDDDWVIFGTNDLFKLDLADYAVLEEGILKEPEQASEEAEKDGQHPCCDCVDHDPVEPTHKQVEQDKAEERIEKDEYSCEWKLNFHLIPPFCLRLLSICLAALFRLESPWVYVFLMLPDLVTLALFS